MIAVDKAQQALRRAALRVHALPDPDAAWLLDALSAPDRATLEPLLRELRALGMPRDPALVPDLADGSPAMPPSERAGSLARLQGRDLIRLEQVLRSEPRTVTARLLELQAWPWTGRIARKLRVSSPGARARGESQSGGALREALIRAIEQELAVPAAPRAGIARWCASAWQRVRAGRRLP